MLRLFLKSFIYVCFLAFEKLTWFKRYRHKVAAVLNWGGPARQCQWLTWAMLYYKLQSTELSHIGAIQIAMQVVSWYFAYHTVDNIFPGHICKCHIWAKYCISFRYTLCDQQMVGILYTLILFFIIIHIIIVLNIVLNIILNIHNSMNIS